jgi:carbon monoxide dehydrogenase subunit G
MTRIESNFIPVSETAEKVFLFLKDLNNHRQIMPSQVTEWWSDGVEAKLKIQGLGALHLKLAEAKANSFLKILPASAAPVDLNLEWNIESDGNGSKVQAVINAELNMMMRMVATKPLQGLADYMANHVNGAMPK